MGYHADDESAIYVRSNMRVIQNVPDMDSLAQGLSGGKSESRPTDPLERRCSSGVAASRVAVSCTSWDTASLGPTWVFLTRILRTGNSYQRYSKVSTD